MGLREELEQKAINYVKILNEIQLVEFIKWAEDIEKKSKLNHQQFNPLPITPSTLTVSRLPVPGHHQQQFVNSAVNQPQPSAPSVVATSISSHNMSIVAPDVRPPVDRMTNFEPHLKRGPGRPRKSCSPSIGHQQQHSTHRSINPGQTMSQVGPQVTRNIPNSVQSSQIPVQNSVNGQQMRSGGPQMQVGDQKMASGGQQMPVGGQKMASSGQESGSGGQTGANHGSNGDPSEMESLLKLFMHAKSCVATDCDFAKCRSMKDGINHIGTCEKRKLCPYPDCMKIKKLRTKYNHLISIVDC